MVRFIDALTELWLGKDKVPATEDPDKAWGQPLQDQRERALAPLPQSTEPKKIQGPYRNGRAHP